MTRGKHIFKKKNSNTKRQSLKRGVMLVQPPKNEDMYYTIAYMSNPETSTLVVISPTSNGWISRSTSKSLFNHQYTSFESMGEIINWIELEASRIEITTCREEVLEYLTTPVDCMDASPLGCFCPNPELDGVGGAERVLQHLERLHQ